MGKIKIYYKQLLDGIKTMFKEFFSKDTNASQRANMWTFSRFIASFLVLLFSLIGAIKTIPIMLWFAFSTAAFGAITDFFDGRSARKHHSESDFGKLLDIVADKTFSFSIGISLSLYNPLFLISLFGEVAISGLNAICQFKYDGINYKSNLLGKIKQWPLSVTFVLGILSKLLPSLTTITEIAIGTTAIFQMLAFANYVKTNTNEIKVLKCQQKNVLVNANTQDINVAKGCEIKNKFNYEFIPENKISNSFNYDNTTCKDSNTTKKYVRKKD